MVVDEQFITFLLVFSGLGILISALVLVVSVRWWRGERVSRPTENFGATPAGAAAPAISAEPVVSSAVDTPPVSPLTLSEPDHEVLRIFRDARSGQLSVMAAGKRYTSLSDVPDQSVSRDILTILSDLQSFAASQSVPVPQPADGTVPPPVRRLFVPPPPVEPDALVVSHASELPPIEVPSMNPLMQVQTLRRRTFAPPIKIKSMTEQIDDVLQAGIAGTELMQRGLSLQTGPQGAAIFIIDGNTYSAIDEIPDPAAQAAVRTAVVEWEKSQ